MISQVSGMPFKGQKAVPTSDTELDHGDPLETETTGALGGPVHAVGVVRPIDQPVSVSSSFWNYPEPFHPLGELPLASTTLCPEPKFLAKSIEGSPALGTSADWLHFSRSA